MSIQPPLENEELSRAASAAIWPTATMKNWKWKLKTATLLSGGSLAAKTDTEEEYRRDYFRQLFRMQAELVKLQDWVVASRQKVLDSVRRSRRGPARAAQSSASAKSSIRAYAGSLRCRHPMTVKEPSGTSSAMCRIFQLPAKSSCSTAAGITARALKR